MKTSTRFALAAVLITAGCLFLLSGFSGGVLFGLATVFFMPRLELTRPVLRRQLWMTFGVLSVLIVLIVAAKYFIPSSATDAVGQVIHHPVFVVPLWLVMLWGLYREWQRQNGEVDA